MVSKKKWKKQQVERQKQERLKSRLEQQTAIVESTRCSDAFQQQKLEQRFCGFKAPLRSFLLVCEGEKTEPQYFESLERQWKLRITCEIVPGSGDPLRVVQTAVETRDTRQAGGRDYNQTWAIFDRDSFSVQRLNEALELARRKNIRVAFSNEAFELWYLLHFKLEDTPRSRDTYKSELTCCMGQKYRKNNPDILRCLSSRTVTALRHACHLEKHYSETAPTPLHERNPYTTVQHLLAALLDGRTYATSVARELDAVYAVMKTLELVERDATQRPSSPAAS